MTWIVNGLITLIKFISIHLLKKPYSQFFPSFQLQTTMDYAVSIDFEVGKVHTAYF